MHFVLRLCTELREAIQAKDQEVELLMSEIESVSGVYEELSEQNSRLVVQVCVLPTWRHFAPPNVASSR
jgi:hypothetical protein